MINDSLSILNTCSVYIADVSKPKEEDSRWFDPAKATVVVALVTLIGTLGSAFIAKADLNFNNSDIDSAIAVQSYKYQEVNNELDADLRELETENSAVNEEPLKADEKALKYKALAEVREKVIAVKTSLPEQFAIYQRQLKAGNHVAALKTQSEINRTIIEKRLAKLTHKSTLSRLTTVELTLNLLFKERPHAKTPTAFSFVNLKLPKRLSLGEALTTTEETPLCGPSSLQTWY